MIHHLTVAGRALAVTLLVTLAPAVNAEQNVQHHVHQMSDDVMPFDIGRTVHLFKMTELGGRQRVILREGEDPQQVSLIQQHLQHEAMRFQHGDFGDPIKLHGASMPGIEEIAKGAGQIRITYSPLPNGAEITFETDDIHLVTSIHRWFGAQLSEHGADAKAE
ncbi:hypothetical protein ADIMK_2041 [Marinobacterium lacunae]|uniref:Aspartate carbamoyltransferase n=1 Tax=Marinobacterium lacunae TaxID=1232683 RepID=A0A081FYY4_9GAMM|nr:hypothetical protein [Marinobacterium lacunae]KEA63739.1 hypothetical protein ADIMK_2041 [Marinobacterium lacunae]